MRTSLVVIAATALLTLAGCGNEEPAEVPAPYSLTADAMGRYCGMNVLEHAGPKGQIIIAAIPEPIWFSSARDTVAFTMLREESRNIAAIYVSDMAKAPSWEDPGADNWVEAREAFFVIESAMRGGMGAPEVVPFSTEAAAKAFAQRNGGRVVAFGDIPEDYVLGSGEAEPDNAFMGTETGVPAL